MQITAALHPGFAAQLQSIFFALTFQASPPVAAYLYTYLRTVASVSHAVRRRDGERVRA